MYQVSDDYARQVLSQVVWNAAIENPGRRNDLVDLEAGYRDRRFFF